MNKKPLVFVLGITADMAFAAGVVMRQLTRHMARKDYDVIIFHNGIAEADAALLTSFPGCALVEFDPGTPSVQQLAGKIHHAFLYRFEIFKLLANYETAVWLDCDICIQGDLSVLAAYGPFGMAMDQNSRSLSGQKTHTLQSNIRKPVAGFDMDRDFYNSGVLVVRDTLPQADALYDWCFLMLNRLAPDLIAPDQAVLNLMLQKFPGLLNELPHTQFNCHPITFGCDRAAIVHCFGKPKFWNNALVSAAVPAWRADYEAWLKQGGSAYTGPVYLPQLMDCSAFNIMYTMMNKLMDMD